MHIRHILFFLGIAAVAGYFIFEARGVLFEPTLYVFEPTSGATFQTTRIHIAGKVANNDSVLVNGKEFIANDKGLFDGMMTLTPGYNELGFLVRDRFGHETRRVVKVVVE